ncbi:MULTISPECIES: hypothetical protein [Idiomarina]|uniref:hypothetical protein n=1 Tax=Idiomarina TaxID=135575 RepID=UPI00129C96EE|nr:MULTISPECIES: hypothetical protein [Idiomarina]MRJ42539.1 hypothetical protein [Idiomarina sp. FeN1]NCU58152.1 hypothetical protein [Idiomarina sp. FenA--70]NCU60850.1 hypothetical protein [Idiomarina sp. FenBw--71]UUN12748.1 hypothetical protein KGF88_08780 [Idiomarina loihiensis]
MRISINSLQNIAIAYVALWVTSPALGYSTIARVLAVLAVAGWLFLELLKPTNLFLRPSIPTILATVFIIYIGVLDYLQLGLGGLIQNFQLFIALFFLYVIESRRHSVESFLPILWWILLTLPITYVKTIYTLWFVNGHAMRTVVRSSDAALELANSGVGGFGLAYSTVIMVPIIYMLFRSRKELGFKPWQNFLVFGNLVLAITLVLSSGFSIAVITMFATLGSLIILANITTTRVLFALFLAAILSVGFKPVLSTSLTAIQPFTQGTNYFIKIRDVLETLEQGEAQGTASERVERWRRSAKLFIENPLLGVWSNRDIGKHSEILDNFAKLGVFFGFLFIYLIFYLPIRYMGKHPKLDGAALSIVVCMLAITFMNSFVATQGLILFLLFPLAATMVASRVSRDDEVAA